MTDHAHHVAYSLVAFAAVVAISVLVLIWRVSKTEKVEEWRRPGEFR